MTHPRKLIRHAIRDALEGATDAFDRVYATRSIELRKCELPVICVYTLEDDVDPASRDTYPRELIRTVPVVIECWIGPSETVDDDMDDFAEQVETAMHADPFFGGVCSESLLDGTVIEVLEQGARRLGMVALTYTVRYYSLAPEAPADGELDDFLTVEATHDLGGAVHVDEQAVDLITVQE